MDTNTTFFKTFSQGEICYDCNTTDNRIWCNGYVKSKIDKLLYRVQPSKNLNSGKYELLISDVYNSKVTKTIEFEKIENMKNYLLQDFPNFKVCS